MAMITLGSGAVQKEQMYRTKRCWQPNLQTYSDALLWAISSLILWAEHR